jgi:8-oxo-dGTP pyrophosphatase MutT (NUDIX family)
MGEPSPAAVLVPIIAREELTVLLTQRTEHLAKHAGQISFPGGKIDADDDGPVAAALREAEEEIGLSARFIEPLGFLDSYRTGTGYRIVPVVALVQPQFTLALNVEEVSDAFEVPLAFLMDEVNHQRHAREWRGRQRQFYAIPYLNRYIWGATAGIIKNMHERLIQR